MKKIIQLTDTHLFASPDVMHYGINPYQNLSGIVHQIKGHHKDCDAIIVTGDLSQDDTVESYQQLVDILTPLGTPFFWLCGNHDVEEATMRAVCPHAMQKRVELGRWQLLLLNSKTPDAAYGTLSEGELSWLENQLRHHPQNTVIALHHPPYKVGSEWIDTNNLRNIADFQRIIKPCDHVKAVIHGHIHQQHNADLVGIPCFATPSTSVQFMPDSETFQIDRTRLPGYRVLTLMDDGQLDTEVIRVDSLQQ
ncbi:3',5'-cyclic-AMP phosphodiesterase [Candidatus Sororendozoicomonas aggregata]|uniref:3',5'-cyclic-AMP phosphodiesterase n=1 Tax=Candidatus Sororendozoicomonas aggregata TaxID=3073239 RepID=UPI002ED37F89